MNDDYELIDSGDGRKLERFGRYVLARPCSQALWRPVKPEAEWQRADASFDREDGNHWHGRANLPKEWTIKTAGVAFKLGGTDFGHLGIFPEQRAHGLNALGGDQIGLIQYKYNLLLFSYFRAYI